MNKRCQNASDSMLDKIADGRMDSALNYVASGNPANSMADFLPGKPHF